MTRLEQLRIEAGLSPEALGKQAGVSGMTIRRIEAGHKAFASTLAKLAGALTTDELRVRALELQRPALEPERSAA